MMDEIRLTQVQLQQALEWYFNAQMLKNPVSVDSVKRCDKSPGGSLHVIVSVKPRETNAREMKGE